MLTKPGLYVLQNDVGPCSSNGLTLAANNIKLDLNRHTVSGQPLVTDADGNATGGFGEGAGIQVVGRNSDEIRNGTVRYFDAGVLLVRSETRSTTNSRVANLNVTSNVGRQVFGEGGGNQSDFSDGIALLGATGNTIESNTLTDNGSRAIGLIEGADNNMVKANTVTANRGLGIALASFNSGNVIDGNTVSANRSTGVNFSFDNPNNVVRNNTIDSNFRNGFRSSVDSDKTLLQKNKVTSNGQNGIAFSSSDNIATQNTVTGNGTRGQFDSGNADGFNISGGFTPDDPRGGNVVKENVVQNNSGNGIGITCTRDFDADPGHPPCVDYNQNNRILNNSVRANGGPQAGTQVIVPQLDADGNQNFSGGFLVGVFDLLDGNNSVNNAATKPPGTATACDNNTWSGNYDGTQTAFPDCTKG